MEILKTKFSRVFTPCLVGVSGEAVGCYWHLLAEAGCCSTPSTPGRRPDVAQVGALGSAGASSIAETFPSSLPGLG